MCSAIELSPTFGASRSLAFFLALAALFGCGGEEIKQLPEPEPAMSDASDSSSADGAGGVATNGEGLDLFARAKESARAEYLTAELVEKLYEIDKLLFAPDGKRLYGVDRNVVVFDAKTREKTDEWKLPEGVTQIKHISVSHDGGTLVAGHEGGMVTVWNTENGTCSRQFTHPKVQDTIDVDVFKTPHCLAVSPNGDIIASGEGTDFFAYVWEADTGKILWTWQTRFRDLKPAEFSPDGKTLAILEEKKLTIRHALTGDTQVEIPLSDDIVYPTQVDTIRFSPDGKRIVVKRDEEIRSVNRSVVAQFNANDGSVHWIFETAMNEVLDIAYATDGSAVVVTGRLWREGTNGDNLTELRNPEDGTILKGLRFVDWILTGRLSIAPDGKQFAINNQIYKMPNGK